MILDEIDIERFWFGVDRRGDDDCWEWRRSCNSQGYGSFGLNGKVKKAHRVAWTLTNGLIPEFFGGLSAYICHSCDNPKCCNPAHLFLGNNKINDLDSAAKGRKLGSAGKCRGENNPRALKTNAEIKEIKQDLREEVLTHKQIGLKHGLAHQTVLDINTGKHWSHITI